MGRGSYCCSLLRHLPYQQRSIACCCVIVTISASDVMDTSSLRIHALPRLAQCIFDHFTFHSIQRIRNGKYLLAGLVQVSLLLISTKLRNSIKVGEYCTCDCLSCLACFTYLCNVYVSLLCVLAVRLFVYSCGGCGYCACNAL